MSEDPTLDKLEKRLDALLPSLRYAGRPAFHTRMDSYHRGEFKITTFLDHGLVLHWCQYFVSQIHLVVPGANRPLTIYEHYRYATPGPHWNYIHEVFSPWLVALARAEKEDDDRKAAAARDKAQRDHDNALAAWARARGPFPIAPEPEPTLDDEWAELRRR